MEDYSKQNLLAFIKHSLGFSKADKAHDEYLNSLIDLVIVEMSKKLSGYCNQTLANLETDDESELALPLNLFRIYYISVGEYKANILDIGQYNVYKNRINSTNNPNSAYVAIETSDEESVLKFLPKRKHSNITITYHAYLDGMAGLPKHLFKTVADGVIYNYNRYKRPENQQNVSTLWQSYNTVLDEEKKSSDKILEKMHLDDLDTSMWERSYNYFSNNELKDTY